MRKGLGAPDFTPYFSEAGCILSPEWFELIFMKSIYQRRLPLSTDACS
jgi:hypothetical protein